MPGDFDGEAGLMIGQSAAPSITRSLVAVALALWAACLVACGQVKPSSSDIGVGGTPPTTVTSGYCPGTPAAGCPCSGEGTVAPCGEVAGKDGNYTFCSEGSRTCQNGMWGSCLGEQGVVAKDFGIAGDLRTLGLGSQTVCTTNPCDPYCENIIDTPTGLTLPDAGVLLTDAGTLTLAGSPGLPPCTGPLTLTPSTGTFTVTSLSPFTTSPASISFSASCATGAAVPTYTLSNSTGTAATIGTIGSTGTMTIYSPVAGTMTVTATNGALTATATITVKVSVDDPNGASSAIVTDLTGAGSTTDTAVALYPYPQTMFPVYMTAPLVQWDSGTGATSTKATAVKIALDYATGNFHWSQIVTGEPEQGATNSTAANVPSPYHFAPAYQIPQAVWSAFELAASSATVIAPAGPYSGAQISFQRYKGSTLYKPVAIPVNFSQASPLNGTVYYVQYERTVTAATGINNVSNLTSYAIGNVCPVGNGTHVYTGGGGSGTRALSVIGAAAGPVDPFAGNATCAVCHSVSALGTTYIGVNQYWATQYGGSAKVGVNTIGAGGTFTSVAAAVPTTNPGGTAPGPRGFSYGALTPDGKFVLQGTEFWGNTAYASSPLTPNPTTLPDSSPANYIAYNITGSTPASATLSGVPNGRLMMTPSFSPDGKHLVYVNGDTGISGTTGWRKGLSMFSVSEGSSSLTFSNEQMLYNTWNAGATGSPLKWPFFESDSRSIVFQATSAAAAPTAYCTTTSVSTNTSVPCYNNPYGSMEPTSRGYWPGILYSLDSGGTLPATPTALTNLNKGISAASGNDDNLSYQPTVLSTAAAGYRWIIFTSPRAYGNQLNNYSLTAATKTDPSCSTSQLWMAAIQDATSGATDRSFPAFWLPNQLYTPIVMGSSQVQYVNERGYLVPSACKVTGGGNASACNVDSDCCSGSCRIDLPAMAPPTLHCAAAQSGCASVGGSCSTSANCCPGETCNTGQCVQLTTYATSTFTRTFTGSCPAGNAVVWQNLQWNASSPAPNPITLADGGAGSQTSASITFSATAAPTAGQLGTGPTVTLSPIANYANSNPPVGNPISNYNYANVENAFLAAHSTSKGDNVLLVTMTFAPSSDYLQAATLYDWDQAFDCVPSE